MKISILDRRYIYIVGCFGPLLVPVELSEEEIKQLYQLGYNIEVHVPNKPPVEDPSVKIELLPNEFTIEEGKTQQLTVYEDGVPTGKKVLLESSEPNVATVNEDLVVEGLSEGVSIITTVHRGVPLMAVATVTAKPNTGVPSPLPLEEEEKKEEVVIPEVQPEVEIVEESVVEEVKEEEPKVEKPVKKTATKKTATKKK